MMNVALFADLWWLHTDSLLACQYFPCPLFESSLSVFLSSKVFLWHLLSRYLSRNFYRGIGQIEVNDGSTRDKAKITFGSGTFSSSSLQTEEPHFHV